MLWIVAQRKAISAKLKPGSLRVKGGVYGRRITKDYIIK